MTCKNQHTVCFNAASSADFMQLWESETNSFSELYINKKQDCKGYSYFGNGSVFKNC